MLNDLLPFIEEKISQTLNRIGNKLHRDIKHRLRDYDKIATGGLIESIAYNVINKDNIWILEVGTNKKYLQYIEEGRKPGSFPNYQAIRNWIVKKREKHATFMPLDINQKSKKKANNETLEKLIDKQAWMVAASIKKKGTEPFPVLQFIYDQNKDFIEKEVNKLVQTITNYQKFLKNPPTN